MYGFSSLINCCRPNPRVRRVMSRIRPLNLSRAFGAMRRSLPSFEMLNPRNLRSSGRATALFASLTLSRALAALANLEERDRGIGAQWRMPIERARYDAELAERRYEAVDPCNRLIAATLETRWNDAVQRLHDLEAELAAFERKTMRAVTAEQKQQILQLTNDFPRLWAARHHDPPRS